MSSGKDLRMRRIFSGDGRALVVAMDHAGHMGPLPGLVNPEATIRQVLKGGADAILTTYGTATRFSAVIGECGLILRLIAGQPLGVEDALRAGADAVMCMYFIGSGEAETARHASELASACAAWNLPLGVEFLPRVAEDQKKDFPALIARGSRIAFEMGADFIKTMYTGAPETFRAVVEGCGVPILVLGGPKMESERDLLEGVRHALDVGARGVAIGRNIWQHEHPERMTAALARLIHDDASVDQSLRELARVIA